MSVIANNHLLVSAKPVRFHFTPADAGLEIEADRLHLANALNNIIDNAIKYSHSSVDIRISYFVQNNKLQIKIEDNGTGIAKEYRSEIFNDFFRVPQGNIHDIKGFGLGLSYVKKVLEKHNGSVKVESELNKGSIFTIILPFNQ
jgi:two-component system, OmpR family, phosphate regulon sensor histidine kinase PhoR